MTPPAPAPTREGTLPDSPSYTLHARDERPWGHYVVVGLGSNDNGEEVCEKRITVEPGQILSLQSHHMRRERWTVLEGTLRAVREGVIYTLEAGQSLDIPQSNLHCMANAGTVPCVVREIQEGICREDDIIRYSDAYGRVENAVAGNPRIAIALAAYETLKKEIQGE